MSKAVTHKHAEAYNLMKYQCQACKNIETFWNSRDGVTPFAMDCLKCSGTAHHIDWHSDIRDPFFGEQFKAGLFPSMRVFIDITKERAVEFATRRLVSFEGTEYPPPARDSQAWRELHARIVEDMFHNGEAPDVITGAEYAKR